MKCFGYNFGSRSNTDDFAMRLTPSMVVWLLERNVNGDRIKAVINFSLDATPSMNSKTV